MNEASQNPNTHEPFERKFRRNNLRFVLVDEFPLNQIRTRPSAQVRTIAPNAPAKEVNRYEIHMRAGDTFPPIVLWGDPDRATDPDAEKILLDGNTRWAAARRLDRVHLPAYVVRCKNETDAVMLGASLNQLGGRALLDDEAREMAVRAMDAGVSDEWIAHEIGVNAGKVRRWRKEKQGEEVADRLGVVDTYAGLPRLQKQRLADLHDEPFKAAVEALADHAPKAEQFTDLMREVREASSDAAAVERIREVSEDWEPASKVARTRPRRSPAAEANKFIGGLLGSPKHPHNVDSWVDLDLTDTLLPRWQQLLDLATNVVAEYERLRQRAA